MRPSGNATGFTFIEYGTSGKWLELLKEIAPRTTRAAVMRDSAVSSGIGQFGAIQSAAPALGVELNPIDLRDAAEIERAIARFASRSNGGPIVTGAAAALAHRNLLVNLAAQHKLPAVYFGRIFVSSGGLISYGANTIEQYRQAAVYVDRILKGERPADLPVQAPNKYELVINLRSAKALGLSCRRRCLPALTRSLNKQPSSCWPKATLQSDRQGGTGQAAGLGRQPLLPLN